MSSRHADWTRLGLALLLAVLAAVPYLPSLRGGLVWDDRMLIAEDGRFLDEHPVKELFAGDFFGRSEEIFRYGYYRPLTSLSYYLTWKLAGDRPLPYHLTNLGLHLAVTLEVWWLLAVMLPGSRLAAWLGAALFAVHPIHVESVAWVAGRTDLLCAALFLPFLVLAWKDVCGERASRARFLLALLLLAAAMLAKEMAACAVPALVLLAISDPQHRRRWSAWAGGAALVTVGVFAARSAVGGVHAPMSWTTGDLPKVLLTAPATLLRYLGKLVLPWRAEPFMINPLRSSLLDPLVIGGVVAAAGLLVWAWRRRSAADGRLAVLFLASFAPVMNLVRITGPVDMGAPMAERFLYLPSVFFSGLAALGLEWLARRRTTARLPVAAACVAVLGAGAATTWARSPLWGDEERLFTTMAAQAPDAVLPHTLLGTLHRRHQRWDEGETELRKALALAGGSEGPEAISILNNLAGCLAAQGRMDEARKLLQAARTRLAGDLARSPAAASVAANLGLVELGAGRRREAVARLREALAADPNHRQALLMQGRLLAGSRPGEAEELLRRYRRRFGDDPGVLAALADAVGCQGRREEARELLVKAAVLAPGRPDIELPLGALELSSGRWTRAEAAFRRVLESDPGNSRALAGAGIAVARQGRWAEAGALLERALAETPGDPELLLNLALVENQIGRKDRARELGQRARSLAPAGGPIQRRAEALLEAVGRGD